MNEKLSIFHKLLSGNKIKDVRDMEVRTTYTPEEGHRRTYNLKDNATWSLT